MKRRPFFLLEAIIAIILIGIFTAISLQGFSHSLKVQKQMIKELEYARLVDLRRMKVVADHWNQMKLFAEAKIKKEISGEAISCRIGSCDVILNQHQKYEITCEQAENCYLLKIKEIKPKQFAPNVIYHYFHDENKASAL